jgi:hypothetical protein
MRRATALASPYADRALAHWRQVPPALRAHMPDRIAAVLPWGAGAAAEEPDPADLIQGEYAALDAARKDRVAKNLALLWDNFQDMFGGISGFLEASQIERDAFMERLGAASARMEAARGTPAAFHYVTVELMRQYVTFLVTGRRDRQAVALATSVVALIDSGRRMTEEPALYSITS